MRSIRAFALASLSIVSALAIAGPSSVATGFRSAAPMSTERANQTATRLADGRVLVTGGAVSIPNQIVYLASSELYDPSTDAWQPAASLSVGRYGHRALLLPSGQVLLAGGRVADVSAVTRASELYDPATDTWTAAQSMNWPRAFFSATLLTSGYAFVCGGTNGIHPSDTCELYFPSLDLWRSIATMSVARSAHTATLLPSGKVLIAGGQSLDGVQGALATAEIYDPVTYSFAPAAPMINPRYGHTATLLPSGKVLVTGGGADGQYLSTAEIYDPALDQWTPAPPLSTPRIQHTATLLSSGKVLVVAGAYGVDLESAELYDPESNSWRPAGHLSRGRYAHSATLLESDRVLFTGGISNAGYLRSAEIYAPETTTAITSISAATTVVGESYTVSVAVSGTTGTPTGSVMVADGNGAACGPVVLSGGVASCALASSVAGELTLTASFEPGDGTSDPSAGTAPHAVDAAATSLALTLAPEPAHPDEEIVATILLTVDAPGAGEPTGVVVVSQPDVGASCTIELPETSCSMPPSTVGLHSVHAVYVSDGNFLESSADAEHLVEPYAVDVEIPSVSPEPSIVGQEVMVNYMVTAEESAPSGLVTVTASTGESCTGFVIDNFCTLVFSVDGPRTLTATYAGDATHASGTSPPVSHNVIEADTSLTITGHSPDPSLPFQAVTVSVQLMVVGPGGGTPHGSIDIGDGVDSCMIPEGASSCDIVLTTRGPRTLTATYGGDGDYNPSSAAVSHRVNQLPIVANTSYATSEETLLDVGATQGVLSGSVDPDGDALSVANAGTMKASGIGGTVELHEDGSFLYTPPPLATGKAEFGYLVSDGYETVGATATITVVPKVDLSVTIDDGSDFAQGGASIEYVIIVANSGPGDAIGARVRDLIPSNLADAVWTCTASTGASCTASGSGDIDDFANVPSGAVLAYVLTANVAADPEMPVVNTVSVTAPAGAIDSDPSNDSATDVDATGLFADGFDRIDADAEDAATGSRTR